MSRLWVRLCGYVVIALLGTLALSAWNGGSWVEELKHGSFLPILPAVAFSKLMRWGERRRAGSPAHQNSVDQ